MKKIKDFNSFNMDSQIMEGKTEESKIKKLFPGFIANLKSALKYSEQRGLKYEIGLKDGDDPYPFIKIDGLKGAIEFPGYSENSSDPRANTDALKRFVSENGIDYNPDSFRSYTYRDQYLGYLESFLRNQLSNIIDIQYPKPSESINYESLPIYKKMMDNGFIDATKKSVKAKGGFAFSHPLFIDGWNRDGSAAQGSIHLSLRGPVRYQGPYSVGTIIKKGIPLTSKDAYVNNINQGLGVIINRVLKDAGYTQSEVNLMKSKEGERLIEDLGRLYFAKAPAEKIDRILSGLSDKDMRLLKNSFSSESEFQDMVELTKTRGRASKIMI